MQVYWLAGTKDEKAKHIYGFLVYGLFFFNHVLGLESWERVDNFRYYSQVTSLLIMTSALIRYDGLTIDVAICARLTITSAHIRYDCSALDWRFRLILLLYAQG